MNNEDIREQTCCCDATCDSTVTAEVPQTDTLVVVSKVKKFIREQSGLNTSEDCINALTRKVVQECLKAIEHARTAGRKTVMGRDIN